MTTFIQTQKYCAFVGDDHNVYLMYRGWEETFIEWNKINQLSCIISIFSFDHASIYDEYSGYVNTVNSDKFIYLTLDGNVGLYNISTQKKRDILIDKSIIFSFIFSRYDLLICISIDTIYYWGYDYFLFGGNEIQHYMIDHNDMIEDYIILCDNNYPQNDRFIVITHHGKLYEFYKPNYKSFDMARIEFSEEILVDDVYYGFESVEDFIIKSKSGKYYKCMYRSNEYFMEDVHTSDVHTSQSTIDGKSVNHVQYFIQPVNASIEIFYTYNHIIYTNDNYVLLEKTNWYGDTLKIKSDFVYYLNDNIHMPEGVGQILNKNINSYRVKSSRKI